MIAFHLRMAWRSLKRTPAITAVMVIALSLGIGTWYAQHQVFAFLESKLPETPSDLYHVGLERGEVLPSMHGPAVSRMPSAYLTPRDAQGVLRANPGARATRTFASALILEAIRSAAQRACFVPDRAEVMRFSRAGTTEALAALLDEVVEGGAAPSRQGVLPA